MNAIERLSEHNKRNFNAGMEVFSLPFKAYKEVVGGQITFRAAQQEAGMTMAKSIIDIAASSANACLDVQKTMWDGTLRRMGMANNDNQIAPVIDTESDKITGVMTKPRPDYSRASRIPKTSATDGYSPENIVPEKPNAIPELVRGINPEEAFEAIAESARKLKPGQKISFKREYSKGDESMTVNIDFYPFGLLALKDRPMRPTGRTTFKRDGGFSFTWRTDLETYLEVKDSSAYEVVEEIARLDSGLTPEEFELRFYGKCPRDDTARLDVHRRHVIEHYASEADAITLMREPGTNRLIAVRSAQRDKKDRQVAEFAIEVDPDKMFRRKGLGEGSFDDTFHILKRMGVRRAVGSYDVKNGKCDKLWTKRVQEHRNGSSKRPPYSNVTVDYNGNEGMYEFRVEA